MKKLILMTLLLALGMGTGALAQSKEYAKQQANYEKTAQKMAKKKAKEFKKQKWENGGATDLETLLATYYLETEPSCGGTKRGIEHMVSDAKTLNVAEKRLLLDAQTAYAQEIQTLLAATMTSQDSATGSDELSTYIANVVAKSKHEFNGDLKRSFIIYRTNPDGKTLTVRAYYTIDENNERLRVKRLAESVKQNAELSKEIEKAAVGE